MVPPARLSQGTVFDATGVRALPGPQALRFQHFLITPESDSVTPQFRNSHGGNSFELGRSTAHETNQDSLCLVVTVGDD